MTDVSAHEPIRFGVFELQPEAARLLKHGSRLKLHQKSFQVLMALVARPGEVVTRDELKRELWSDAVFVEFDNNLNNAVSRLREALGDSVDNPRFIETVPREGYRFIAPVETSLAPSTSRSRRFMGVAAAGSTLVVSVIAYYLLSPRTEPFDSIAVLPFVTSDPSGDAEDQYLAFGVTESLTAELSRVHALNVISQTSARRYADTTKSLPEIADELGVDAVVEGSVLLEGQDAQVTVQLIDASTDTHLWSGSYHRTVDSIFSVQREVAYTIAREIRVQLPQQGESPSRPERIVSPAVRQDYLKGRFFLYKGTEQSLHQAIQHFDDAIAADPNHAASYAALAEAYSLRSAIPPKIGMPLAEEYALKALELDETLADAHVSLGFVRFQKDWDWAAAESEFQDALELNPSDAAAHRLYGLFLASMARHRDAQIHAERALELDPVSVATRDTAAGIFYLGGRYDRAMDEAREIVNLDPAAPHGPYHLALNLIQLERYEESVVASEMGLSLSDGDPAFYALLARAQQRLHNVDAARRAEEELVRASVTGHVPPFFRVVASMGRGNNDEAIGWLEESFRQHDPYMVFLGVNPFADPLRDDDRFQALISQMNFPAPDGFGPSTGEQRP